MKFNSICSNLANRHIKPGDYVEYIQNGMKYKVLGMSSKIWRNYGYFSKSELKKMVKLFKLKDGDSTVYVTHDSCKVVES